MQELKKMKIWICWNHTLTRDNKPTKKPLSANGTTTGTNEKYRSTWVSYEEATISAKEHGFNGVGFIIPEGYYFLDIDHRNTEDALTQTLLTRHDTYAERSVSKSGFHIYGKCNTLRLPITNGKLDKKYYTKNPHNHLELYIGGATNRFAVFTSDVIYDKPVRESTSAILTTLEKDMIRKPPVNNHSKSEAEQKCFDIICSLRKDKNSEKFIRLYDTGNITEFQSASEADLSLCSMIAFRTGDNPELIDAIFRKSALYRDKWEREDYRSTTIEKAVEACQGVFHYSIMPHPDYFIYDPKSRKMNVSCPILARHIRNDLHYIFVRDNAHSGVLKYVYENGCYRLYADEMLKGIIKRYITDYDENLLKMSYVEEVFKQLTTDLVFAKNENLNSEEGIINFSNGLLRLEDMTLLPHTPDTLSTIQIACEWTGHEEPTPVFDNFLHTLTDGDNGTAHLLLQFMGACLSNIKGWRLKKALFLYGKGDTGKSQLKALTEKLLGKGNYVGIDLREIEARFGTGNIYGKRLAGSSDMSFLSIDELKTFKKCTGGDSLFAEFKGQNGFEFIYDGLLWFCMNRLPKFGGDNGQWVYDRMIQIECKNVIPKEKQDKFLLDKMYAERNGIVYKAIMALKSVISAGYQFTEPHSVIEARKIYMEENNTVISFYNDCMTKRPNGKITDQCTTGRIFKVYRAWCTDNNHGYAQTAKEFRDTLALHLDTTFSQMTVHRGKGGTFYREYTLTTDAKELYAMAYGYDETEFLSSAG